MTVVTDLALAARLAIHRLTRFIAHTTCGKALYAHLRPGNGHGVNSRHLRGCASRVVHRDTHIL